jgi:hypothetical protein
VTAWWRELRAAWAELRALRRLDKRIDAGLPVPEILAQLDELEARFRGKGARW